MDCETNVTPREVMPDTETATELLHDLLSTEVEMMKQVNSRHGGPTKKLLKEEKEAIEKVFLAMTGFKPNAEQLRRLTEL